jgi:hypothetical protein
VNPVRGAYDADSLGVLICCSGGARVANVTPEHVEFATGQIAPRPALPPNAVAIWEIAR